MGRIAVTAALRAAAMTPASDQGIGRRDMKALKLVSHQPPFGTPAPSRSPASSRSTTAGGFRVA